MAMGARALHGCLKKIDALREEGVAWYFAWIFFYCSLSRYVLEGDRRNCGTYRL